jgi:hypothetical protein
MGKKLNREKNYFCLEKGKGKIGYFKMIYYKVIFTVSFVRF